MGRPSLLDERAPRRIDRRSDPENSKFGSLAFAHSDRLPRDVIHYKERYVLYVDFIASAFEACKGSDGTADVTPFSHPAMVRVRG